MIPVNIGVSIWYGPVYGGVPGLVPPPMRATASAILLFVINMIGLGGGPTLFGMLSDAMTNHHLLEAGSQLTVAACQTATDTDAATCAAGAAAGIKSAIYLSTSVLALAIACFFLARTTIRKDMES